MSHAIARRLFSNALVPFTTINGIPVAFDNIDFSDDERKVYPRIKVHMIPADTFTETLSGDHECDMGMFQMTIVTKQNTGDLDHESIAIDLKRIFKINSLFTDVPLGYTVQVISPLKTTEGRLIGVEWLVPYYFDYRSDTNVS